MEKSKIQLAIQKATNILKFFTEKAEKFESVKVVDSDQLIEYSELVVGADVSVSTSDGSVPAPDGTHKLVNGAEIVVVDGKIREITKEADEAVTETEELADEVVEDLPPEKSEEVKALEEKVSKLEEAVKAIMEVIELQPSADQVAEFNSKVEKLSKLPTQVSVDARVEIKDSVMEKYSKLAELYSKNNI